MERFNLNINNKNIKRTIQSVLGNYHALEFKRINSYTNKRFTLKAEYNNQHPSNKNERKKILKYFIHLFQVRESDPRPLFERDIYTAGIYDTDTPNRELLTVHVRLIHF